MKKIIQRTKRFEKSYLKLDCKLKKLFIIKLDKFIDNEFDPSLNTHKLNGKMKSRFAFSVTSDVRALYKKEVQKNIEVITFTFVDIGTHNKVY